MHGLESKKYMLEMTYDEFVEKYVKTNKKWNFELFNIVCKKCGSDKVEFNGDIGIDCGYYQGEAYLRGKVVVKCHGCGNAFTIDADVIGE